MEQEIKILILEDKEVDYNIIDSEIKRTHHNFNIKWVQDEKTFEEALINFQPDVVLSDYNLPSFDGIKAIKKVKKINNIIPVIIVTGSINEDTAVECIKAGACDYVIKEHLKRLVPAIFHALNEKELNIQKIEAEKKLRQSEESYRLLFESNPHPMWVYDLETLKFLAVNEAAEKKYGYSKAEFLNLTLKDIRPIEEIPKLLENIKHDKSEILFSSEWKHKSKDGKIFFVEIISHKILFNGIPARLVLANDITERRRAEEKLLNQLKIFDEVQDAILATDSNYKITFWNKAAEKIFGWTAEEAFGKNDTELLSAEFLEYDKEKFFDQLHEKKTNRTKILARTKNNLPIYIDSIYNLMYDVDGLINGYVVVSRDITQEKQIEFALKSAKEKAEEANKLKTYFLNNVSHELRTPLVPIISAAELLLEELDNKEHLSLADSILQGGKRLNSTITKILELTDLESLDGKVILTNENISQLVRSYEKEYQQKAKEKGLDFQLQIKDENVISPIEKSYFKKILDQLVDNAITFTNRGFVLIKVEKESENWNKIVVQDTGVGIPIEKQKIIFEPFRQSSEGYSRAYEGTGLGLTLVNRYKDLLRGKISVESIPGVGSSFELLLPTSIEQEKKDDFLLLFVDDDIESLNTYRRLLKDKYKYDLCHSINDAKIIAASKKYDIIFLDINLSSNFNGFELLDYYLTYPHLHDTYFVALTAYASSEDRLRIKSAGFSNFLAKPFTKDELIGIIEKRRKEIQK